MVSKCLTRVAGCSEAHASCLRTVRGVHPELVARIIEIIINHEYQKATLQWLYLLDFCLWNVCLSCPMKISDTYDVHRWNYQYWYLQSIQWAEINKQDQHALYQRFHKSLRLCWSLNGTMWMSTQYLPSTLGCNITLYTLMDWHRKREWGAFIHWLLLFTLCPIKIN